jgi:hypothetical protein
MGTLTADIVFVLSRSSIVFTLNGSVIEYIHSSASDFQPQTLAGASPEEQPRKCPVLPPDLQ